MRFLRFLAAILFLGGSPALAEPFQAKALGLAEAFKASLLAEDAVPFMIAHQDIRLQTAVMQQAGYTDLAAFNQAALTGYATATQALDPVSADVVQVSIRSGRTAQHDWAVVPIVSTLSRVESGEVIRSCHSFAVIGEGDKVFPFLLNPKTWQAARQIYPDLPDLTKLLLSCAVQMP